MAEPRELSAKARRRGLDFAGRVSQLALEAPDLVTKQEVYKAARAIEKKYGFTLAEKKAYLMRLIEVGAASHNELIAESGFHRDDVHSLVNELEAAGLIRIEKLTNFGRPAVRIFLK
jgi:DNA-binding MarR family transcriptional regulator